MTTTTISNTDEPFNWLNDQQLQDLGIERAGNLPNDLKNAGYEKIYRVRDNDQLRRLLGDKEVKDNVKKTVARLEFKRCSAVFHLMMAEPVEKELLEQTVDFQKDIFTDITVTYLPDQPQDFTSSLARAKKIGKPVNVYVPIECSTKHVEDAASIVAINPELHRLKLKYGKYSTHMNKYAVALATMGETKKQVHVTMADRRCNLTGCKKISAEFIGRRMGIRSFCLDFPDPSLPKSSHGFATTTRVFNQQTLEYDDVPNSDMTVNYKTQRARNLISVEQEMRVYAHQQQQNKLIEYIKSKRSFAQALASIGVLNE